MQEHRQKEEHRKLALTISVTLYLLLATTVCVFIISLSAINPVTVKADKPGMTDLTAFDFSNQIAQVATASTHSIYIYSGAFYMPEDFASGNVSQEGVLYDRTGGAQGDYGTLRMQLKLPPGHVYAIAAKNVSYAQRLFIDGQEYASVGVPGDRAETVVPQSRRFVEAFLPTGETTEIIFHYSAFVHADGGGLYPMTIGYVKNITRSEQLGVFYGAAAAAMLLTIMVFFFGLFLFFRDHRYLLWFSLLCGGIAIRQLGEKALGHCCRTSAGIPSSGSPTSAIAVSGFFPCCTSAPCSQAWPKNGRCGSSTRSLPVAFC